MQNFKIGDIVKCNIYARNTDTGVIIYIPPLKDHFVVQFPDGGWEIDPIFRPELYNSKYNKNNTGWNVWPSEVISILNHKDRSVEEQITDYLLRKVPVDDDIDLTQLKIV